METPRCVITPTVPAISWTWGCSTSSLFWLGTLAASSSYPLSYIMYGFIRFWSYLVYEGSLFNFYFPVWRETSFFISPSIFCDFKMYFSFVRIFLISAKDGLPELILEEILHKYPQWKHPMANVLCNKPVEWYFIFPVLSFLSQENKQNISINMLCRL